ncbi:MAG: CMP-N-acetylneuraminic acid synthetase, partial [Candidatus Omnitrophica bacterium]|nr:CMP-N-acetylneuraminic acid synthetase [Candidatus Omnitrophota bacterium]
MAKVVAMIPARLGSKRVKNKNLRLLSGKPLVCHVLEKAMESKIFEEIYVNSEADIFREIAQEYGTKFYKRSKELAGDGATNDMFVFDFIKNVSCDLIIQINPTSPLITADDIRRFVKTMLEDNYDTLHGVKKEQIETLFRNKSLNFDPLKAMPRSQDLEPVMLFSSGIMGWSVPKYHENMEKYGCATYGGDGKTGYFVLTGFSAIDIDEEEDFQLAEIACQFLNRKHDRAPEYFLSQKERKKLIPDADRKRILTMDGVKKLSMEEYNKEITNIPKIIEQNSKEKSWSYTLINSPSNCATLIGQMPGEGNRMHFHLGWDEWWYIVEGQWEWIVDGISRNV